MTVDLKKAKSEAPVTTINPEVEADDAAYRPSIFDYVGTSVTIKMDSGRTEIPIVGKLIDIDEYGYLFIECGNNVSAINGAKIISVTQVKKIESKVDNKPDGIAVEHQKRIDNELVADRNKAELRKEKASE